MHAHMRTTRKACRLRFFCLELSARNYVQWSLEMDQASLDVLVEHHKNGVHVQNGWKPHVYNNAVIVVIRSVEMSQK